MFMQTRATTLRRVKIQGFLVTTDPLSEKTRSAGKQFEFFWMKILVV